MLVDESRTTVGIQGYLDDLAVRGASSAEPAVRATLSRAVNRLHELCTRMLHRSYPRLTRGPLNLQSEEMLDAVVERLLKAMRQVRPQTVRQFFALANQHMRWELNDLARHLDAHAPALELRDSRVQAPAAPETSEASACPNLQRILDAIEGLPEDERETFNLVRIQGMTYGEAAEVMDCSEKTVQRRLNRCLAMLSEHLGDLVPHRDARPAIDPEFRTP